MRREQGFNLIELMIVSAIISVLATIAGTRVMRARMSANEASAVASLRVVNAGQAAYSSSCAAGSYAIDLADLVKAPSGAREAFVSPDLSSNGVRKSGYQFSLAKSAAPGTTDSTTPTCNNASATPASAYQASADPFDLSLGGRFFATDRRGSIYEDASGALPNPIPDTAGLFH